MRAEQPTGPAAPVVLRLTLDRGERIRGTVERADGTRTHPFTGWVDLMSAIETLRGAAAAGRCDVPRTQRPAMAAEPCHLEEGQ